MNNTLFEVYDMPIDYRLLGTYPKNIDSLNDEEILDLFMQSFKLTFSGTVFSYYGTLEESRELIDDSLIKDDLDYKNRTNKQKWAILFLIVFSMFYQMHNTYFAQTTIQNVCDNFDIYTDEELMRTISDLNFSLFFGIEECMVVSPSQIKNLQASNEDAILLDKLVDNQEEIIKIIKRTISKRDISKKDFENLFTSKLNSNYALDYFDGFVSSWIEMMSTPEESFKDINHISVEEWQTVSAEIYTIITAFFSLTILDDDLLLKISDNLYYFIIKLYKKELNISYKIIKIE